MQTVCTLLCFVQFQYPIFTKSLVHCTYTVHPKNDVHCVHFVVFCWVSISIFSLNLWSTVHIQYIPWIMYTVCTLLCFVGFQYPIFTKSLVHCTYTVHSMNYVHCVHFVVFCWVSISIFSPNPWCTVHIQYIPWIMYTVCTLLCFVGFQYPFFHQILGALYIYSTSQEWCTLCPLCCVSISNFSPHPWCTVHIQYIPRIMHTVCTLLRFVGFQYPFFTNSFMHCTYTVHLMNYAHCVHFAMFIGFKYPIPVNSLNTLGTL